METKLDLHKERRFVLAKAPNTRGEQFAPTESVPGECEVYDPILDRVRTAIYLPGVSSIWVDEIESLKGKDKIRGKKILFTNGWKIVSAKEANLLKYLLVAGYNEANTETRVNSAIIYKEWKTDQIAEKRFEANKKIDNAIFFINNGEIREVRACALALASNDREWKAIQEASEFEVRIALRPIAEKNPEKFDEVLQDTSFKNKVKIIQSIYADIIILDEPSRTILWKNGGVIVTAPIGRNVVNHFAEVSVDSLKFKTAFETMVDLLEGSTKKVAEKPKKEEVEKVEEKAPEPSTPQEILLADAMAKGIITGGKNNMWFKYGEEKYQTKDKLLKELKSNTVLFEELFNLTK